MSKKLISVLNIIENMSGYDSDAPTKFCHLVNDFKGCDGVQCDNCAFNDNRNFDKAANEVGALLKALGEGNEND